MIMTINPESEVIEPEGQRNVKIKTDAIDEAALHYHDGPVREGKIVNGTIRWTDGRAERWEPKVNEEISEEEYQRRYKFGFVVRKSTPNL